jgi:hypothetical protein
VNAYNRIKMAKVRGILFIVQTPQHKR